MNGADAPGSFDVLLAVKRLEAQVHHLEALLKERDDHQRTRDAGIINALGVLMQVLQATLRMEGTIKVRSAVVAKFELRPVLDSVDAATARNIDDRT